MKIAVIIVMCFVGLLLIVSGGAAFVGCNNPYTQAGFEGYVHEKPISFGKGGFIGTMTGPGRYGLSWRTYVTNVDMRINTYTENFNIMAKDDLNIAFQVHLKMSVKPGGSKVIVEKYGGEFWYARFVKEQLRTYVRNSVIEYTYQEAKQNRDKMRDSIVLKLKHMLVGTPLVVEDIVVGNIDYPQTVQDAVERKLAKQQKFEEQEYEIKIARKIAEIKEIEAHGIAAAQNIINKTLTTDYLRHEWIQALEKSANTPNTTIIYIPVGSDGLPVFENVNK